MILSKHSTLALFFLLFVLIAGSFTVTDSIDQNIVKKSDKVYDVLTKLGDEPATHLPDYSINGVSTEVGRDIVHNGSSDIKGQRKASRQSKYFKCTSCHNVTREDFDLANTDPEARLQYTTNKGIPFLQGTTLYGAVNRTSFYNGDYSKKYGELVDPARNDIREAIQLCAKVCSQGRPLQDWELESVLAYLWTIDLTMGDLLLTPQNNILIENAFELPSIAENAIALIKSKYLRHSPATFAEPPSDRRLGYDVNPGNPEKGKNVYDMSCKHCHYKMKYSYLDLNDEKLTFKWLANKIDSYSRYSLYQVVRFGTYSKNGKKAYMPNYTKEKMSDQQIEDLRAYLTLMAD